MSFGCEFWWVTYFAYKSWNIMNFSEEVIFQCCSCTLITPEWCLTDLYVICCMLPLLCNHRLVNITCWMYLINVALVSCRKKTRSCTQCLHPIVEMNAEMTCLMSKLKSKIMISRIQGWIVYRVVNCDINSMWCTKKNSDGYCLRSRNCYWIFILHFSLFMF
jgi:hypothetical protein